MVPKLFQSFEDNKPNASLLRIFVFNVELLKYCLRTNEPVEQL